MKYRAEIDGLRALAVIPVIFFHAGFELFSGGFVGVDVFFVISGYLITTIIIAELAEERFSLLNFYERRARRILPALFFVVLICIPFAWMWLLPRDMKDFSQSLFAVATFSSNIFFLLESGYFDTASELKPLLHTWSLAVEEQYYIIFPLLLMLVWRLGRKSIIVILVFLFLVSLGYAQWGAYNNPAAAFFLLPTRGWEILLGAFCALYLNKNNVEVEANTLTNILSFFGFILILTAVFYFSETTPTPSLYTLMPTLGTVLIILFAAKKTIVNTLLSTKQMVGIGLISYSAYLWHQPILALMRYRLGSELVAMNLMAALISTVVLAYLTWLYVEKPFRSRDKFGRKLIFSTSVFSLVLLALVGLVGHFNVNNVLTAFRENLYATNDREVLTSKDQFSLGMSGEPILLWGDSYADSLSYELGERLNELGVPMVGFIKHACPSIINVTKNEDKRQGKGNSQKCVNYNSRTLEEIKSLLADADSPRYIVITSSYLRYMTALNTVGEPILIDDSNPKLAQSDHVPKNLAVTIKTLISLGLTPIVVLPYPAVPGFEEVLRTGDYQDKTITTSTLEAKIQAALLEDSLMNTGAKVISAARLICGNVSDNCKVFLDGKKKPYVWYDGSHLSRHGAEVVVDEILKIVADH